METVDLLIIGAGPAGVSTALHLLQQDASWAKRMLLLEKSTHPRPKPCGGGVTLLGLRVLRDLGFPLPLPISQAQVNDVRLKYGTRTIHVRGNPQIVIFHRPELDAYLAQKAQERGVTICENEAVNSFQIEDEGIRVTTTQGDYIAKAIVAADGSKGIIRRTLNRGQHRKRIARLMEELYSAREEASLFTERYALFDFTPVGKNLQGYCWDFPSRVNEKPMFNRGVYDARLAPNRPRAHLPELLSRFVDDRDEGVPDGETVGHPIHWFSPRNRFSWPRLLLVGDAAGVDPLFGEGIAPALAYGQVAAQAVERAFRTGDFSFSDYRMRVLTSPVGRYLLLRWLVAEWGYRLSGHAWYMRLLWRLGDILARLWPQPTPLY